MVQEELQAGFFYHGDVQLDGLILEEDVTIL